MILVRPAAAYVTRALCPSLYAYLFAAWLSMATLECY